MTSNTSQRASGLTAYLSGVSGLTRVRDYKKRTYEWMGATAGNQVLDIGCELGDDVAALAGIVGESGRACDVDRSGRMIEAARERHRQMSTVTFEHVDIEDLLFADGTFDSARADRVLRHVAEPELAVQRMLRVLRPGGRLVLTEPDWGTLAIAGAGQSVSRRVRNACCEGLRHGEIGRELPGLVKHCGARLGAVIAECFVFLTLSEAETGVALKAAVFNAHTSGRVSAAEATGWLEELHRSEAETRFCCLLSGIGVVAIRSEFRTTEQLSLYCKAYPASRLRAYEHWRENPGSIRPTDEDDQGNTSPRVLADNDILFVHDDFVVTDGILPRRVHRILRCHGRVDRVL